MEQSLKGDKISHIYFIVRLIITCIGFIITGFSLLVLGVNLSKTPAYATSIDGELGQSLSGLSIVIGAIGFFIVVYCVIVLAIGVVLDKKEFDSLVFEYDIAELNAGEVYKNYQSITTISELNGHYFKTSWRMDLTDMGEHQFDNAPVEVKKTSKVTGYDLNMKPIEVTVWEEV